MMNTNKKVITSMCPVCHGSFKEDFDAQKYNKILGERYMFRKLVGIKCRNCPDRWLLGSIEDETILE